MRQTLFHIPHAVGGWPLFGFQGGLLWIWLVACAAWVAWQLRRRGWNDELRNTLPLMLVVSAGLALIVPLLEEQAPDGTVLGLPIRGYGVMVLAGVVAGITLAVAGARREGIHPDTIISLSFWVFLCGIVGARTYYVIEYWDEQFRQPTWFGTLREIARYTEGGIVVYGALAGAALAMVVFVWRRRLPLLAVADLVAPSLMVGLALGRIGCLMNGCCYGGVCDNHHWGITFPAGSPPYAAQLRSGELLGLQIHRDAAGAPDEIERVDPAGKAAQAGVEAHERVARWDIERALVPLPASPLSDVGPVVVLDTAGGHHVAWSRAELPARSRPVYPSQIYAAINAAAIALFLWSFYPFRRRDGAVFALLLTIYPITRFLEEMIRTDEPPVWGTVLNWAQWISVCLLAGVLIFWVWLLRRPTRLGLAEMKPK